MKNIETRLKNLLSEFTLLDPLFFEGDNRGYFGTKKIAAGEFRNRNKALVLNSGIRNYYLSSVMYKDNPNMQSFRYMIVWTRAQIRPYRCKSFSDYEMDKVYLSGKTDEILIENLRREIENGTI